MQKREPFDLKMDMGLMAMLTGLYAIAMAATLVASADLLVPQMVMVNLLFVLIILAYYFGLTFSLVSAIISVFGVSSYLLYRLFALGIPIESLWYLWLILLPVGAVGMGIFQTNAQQLQNRAQALADQQLRLVEIDAATGLNNLRALSRDMRIFISLCARHKLPLCYMHIELRYYNDLLRVAGPQGMQALITKLIQILKQTLRTDDQLYRVDEQGALGAILITDAPEVVVKRIHQAVEEQSGEDQSAVGQLKMQVRIGVVPYQSGMDDLSAFLAKAKQETEYDV